MFYSFNIEKQLFTFGGGMVTTNNEELYGKLCTYRDDTFSKPSFFSELKKAFLLLNTPIIFSDYLFRWIYALWNMHGILSWKMKGWSLDSSTLPVEKIYSIQDNIAAYSCIQAAVGLSQLRKIKDSIQKRIKIAKRIVNAAKKDKAIKMLAENIISNMLMYKDDIEGEQDSYSSYEDRAEDMIDKTTFAYYTSFKKEDVEKIKKQITKGLKRSKLKTTDINKVLKVFDKRANKYMKF